MGTEVPDIEQYGLSFRMEGLCLLCILCFQTQCIVVVRLETIDREDVQRRPRTFLTIQEYAVLLRCVADRLIVTFDGDAPLQHRSDCEFHVSSPVFN